MKKRSKKIVKRKVRAKPQQVSGLRKFKPKAVKKSAKKKGNGFKRHTVRVTTSSKKMDWRTPGDLIKLIEKVAGKIKLDPSADPKVKHQFAKKNFTGRKDSKDGLTESWRGYGVVYSNPPYGRGIVKWAIKAVNEFIQHTPISPLPGVKNPKEAIAWLGSSKDHCFLLLPARPDTKWFQKELLPYASALCFWRGRLKFSGHNDAAPFPSLIVYFGNKPKRFRKVFKKFGWVPKLAQP